MVAWAATLVPVLLLGVTPRPSQRLLLPSLLQALLVAGRDHWIIVTFTSNLRFALSLSALTGSVATGQSLP